MQNFPKPKKIKIVLLGNRSVGKSSIIRRFILDDFPHDIQVTFILLSQLLGLIICPKPLHLKEANTGCNSGILQAKRNIGLLSRVI